MSDYTVILWHSRDLTGESPGIERVDASNPEEAAKLALVSYIESPPPTDSDEYSIAEFEHLADAHVTAVIEGAPKVALLRNHVGQLDEVL